MLLVNHTKPKTLCTEINTFLAVGNYKSASGKLKNNFVNVDYNQLRD